VSGTLTDPPAPSGWNRWWDGVWTRRDRLVANPRFQRLAAALPFTAWIARRRAAGLFDLVAGFVYSQVLLACVRLRVFELLADGPLPLSEIAPRLGLNPAATQRLLAAAVSLQLLEHRRGGRYGLGALGAPLVGNQALLAMIEHHAALYADLRDPVALLRGESGTRALAAYWPYADPRAVGADDARAVPGAAHGHAPTADHAAAYSALMSASQPQVAEQVLDAYPIKRHQCLLDVGGGEGVFLAAAAARAPKLRLQLFDLPPVAELARHRLSSQGLGDRCEVHGGSFFDDPLPRGADVVSLVRVIFDHADERALQILQAVRRALPPGGTVLVAEPMAQTPGAEAMGDAYFGFYLLAMGRGRPRSAQEIATLLERAGFVGMRLWSTRMPLQARLISGQAPADPVSESDTRV
jgi:demethylspheroidene O-methyltransferase